MSENMTGVRLKTCTSPCCYRGSHRRTSRGCWDRSALYDQVSR